MDNCWLIRLYNACLLLYPRPHQAEFGEEMREVFCRAVEEAEQQNRQALMALCWRELAALPAALWQAHHKAASAQIASPGKSRRAGNCGAPVSADLLTQPWKELLLALAILLLPGALSFAGPTQSSIGASPAPTLSALLLFLAVMTLWGWLGGAPLRSSPYIGMILAVAGYLTLFHWIAAQISPTLVASYTPGAWDRSTLLLLQAASMGMTWLMFFCLTLLIATLLSAFNRLRPLLQSARQDWTLLSYVLYGESVFALLLFQGRSHAAGYAFARILVLAAGAWFYLRGSGEWRRVTAMLVCLTLAAGIVAWEMLPIQPGAIGSLWRGFQLETATRLGLAWLAMAAALLLPGLLAHSKGNQPVSDSGLLPGR